MRYNGRKIYFKKYITDQTELTLPHQKGSIALGQRGTGRRDGVESSELHQNTHQNLAFDKSQITNQ